MQLSIIVPTYNRACLLREAILSCTKLGFPVELLVVDDCSNDHTTAVLEGLSAHLLSFGISLRCLTTDRNSGAQVCRNLGFARSTGQSVLFMDSDDVLIPDGVRLALAKLERCNCDFVYGQVQLTDERLNLIAGKIVGAAYSPSGRDLAGYHWHTMGAIYRRGLLERVGPWNEALTGSQDWEFQARVKIEGGIGSFVEVVVGYWRQHEGCRVGTAEFRPDYVRSVMLACDAILARARDVGVADAGLERRLAAKLAVHALEWGWNGYPVERFACLQKASDALTRDRWLKRAILWVQACPSVLDRIIWNRLVASR